MNAIDLFAGLGGWTEGASHAGATVLWAANHWQQAVEVHASNHPATTHVCQDLHQADWSHVPSHDLMLASPACQGHAKARGKERPHHDASRSTAWAVVSCAEYHRPPLIAVENVPEMAGWALFPAWKSALHSLGYATSEAIIDAADCGTPQNRRRLIVLATRSKSPLTIPQPTKDRVAASTFIDFEAGNWSNVHRKGRADATLERYRAGRADYGERFIFSYYGNTRNARSLSRPIGTITTRDRWGVVDGQKMRMLMIPEAAAAMGFRPTYSLPENSRLAMHMLGNAVPPPLAEYVISFLKRAA